MIPGRSASLRLFQVAGIEVRVHAIWLLVAFLQIGGRTQIYPSIFWNIAEYLAVALIILAHEFGHVLATRQVGGEADQILLWPLGGVAYVAPPPRPAAELWSIAAGPLVNLILYFFLGALLALDGGSSPTVKPDDIHNFLHNVSDINLGLLLFNLLPIYPLDGSRILRALLWFPLGPTRSLLISILIGFPWTIGLAMLAFQEGSLWLGLLTLYVFVRYGNSLNRVRALWVSERLPGHPDFACPACSEPPPMGNFWACDGCHIRFDPFEWDGICPDCVTQINAPACPSCGESQPFYAWRI